MNANWNRRNFFRNAVLGTLGIGAASHLKSMGLGAGLEKAFEDWMGSQTTQGGWDAFTQLQDALKGGPSLLGVSQAFAQSPASVAFLDLFMGISSDCRHYLNLSAFGDKNNIFSTLKSFGATATPLNGMIQDHPNYKGAKVNRWFGELVLKGKSEANPVLPGFEGRVKAIEPDKLCFVSFCSYLGTGVHQNGQVEKVGTIAYLMQSAFKLSPIGISAIGQGSGAQNSQLQAIAFGKPTAAFVGDLEQFVSPSYYNREPAEAQNLILQLDSLVDSAEAKELRGKWLSGLSELQKQVESWKVYGPLSGGQFNPFAAGGVINMGGNRDTGRCSAVALAGAMAKSGLGMVSTVNFPTFDFHADDVARTNQTMQYNMQHAYMEAGTGLNIWANDLIASKKDGVAFIRTCSGRNEDWVQDSATVSGLMIVVRGADRSPLAGMQNMYYGPSSSGSFVEASTLEWAPGMMGLGGGRVTTGAVEGAVATVVAKACGQTFNVDMQTPIGKII